MTFIAKTDLFIIKYEGDNNNLRKNGIIMTHLFIVSCGTKSNKRQPKYLKNSIWATEIHKNLYKSK